MNDQQPGVQLTTFATTTFMAVMMFGVLLLSRDHRVTAAGLDLLSIPIGIAGLLFLAIALRSLRSRQVATEPPLGLLLELALWTLAVGFVIALASAAHG